VALGTIPPDGVSGSTILGFQKSAAFCAFAGVDLMPYEIFFMLALIRWRVIGP
jgi:hypothetical protein